MACDMEVLLTILFVVEAEEWSKSITSGFGRKFLCSCSILLQSSSVWHLFPP
jgi:hypothetical protein